MESEGRRTYGLCSLWIFHIRHVQELLEVYLVQVHDHGHVCDDESADD